MKKIIRGGIFLLYLEIIAILTISFYKAPISQEYKGAFVKEDLLESFYRDEIDYTESFSKISGDTKENILAGVITHHFLAKDLIAEFFSEITLENVETIYIVGPDHFDTLDFEDIDVISTYLNWKTPFGNYFSDRSRIGELVEGGDIEIKDLTFRKEHSIYTLIPFAKKVFPDSKVIPLVLRSRMSLEKCFKIGSELNIENSLLIVSVDFSHHATKEIAQENDGRSIEALSSMEIEDINNITSDCRECISLLYGYVSKQDSKFELLANMTSGDFGSEDLNNLTSYIAGYYILR